VSSSPWHIWLKNTEFAKSFLLESLWHSTNPAWLWLIPCVVQRWFKLVCSKFLLVILRSDQILLYVPSAYVLPTMY
jgi:hypothetical protein